MLIRDRLLFGTLEYKVKDPKMCMGIFSKKEARLLRAENYWVQKIWLFCQQESNSKLQLDGSTEARWDSPDISCRFFINRTVPHSFIFYSPQNWLKKVQNTTDIRILWNFRKLIGADQNMLYTYFI